MIKKLIVLAALATVLSSCGPCDPETGKCTAPLDSLLTSPTPNSHVKQLELFAQSDNQYIYKFKDGNTTCYVTQGRYSGYGAIWCNSVNLGE